MPAKIDKETVKRVAKIARIELTEKELEMYTKDLQQILKAFEVLQQIDTKNVKPTFQPVEIKNVLRDDVPERCLTQEEALSNVKKNKEKGYFKGPAAI